MAEKSMDLSHQPSETARHELFRRGGHTFGLIDDMDRIFHDFDLGWGWRPGFGRSWLKPMGHESASHTWMPNVEVFQRGNELVVRADLPGLRKEDVKVDVTDAAITIQGERRWEEKEERGGVFRSERSYGSFRRVIPLPEGAITDQAKAAFRDGVLEITMPAPPEQVTRGRRLDISEGTPSRK